MIKHLSKSFNLFVLLLVGLFMVTTASGQSSTPQGNIIKGISLETNNNEQYLVLQGIFSPDTLEGLNMQTRSKKHVLTIPSAARDTETLPSQYMTFNTSDPLEKITIAEQPMTDTDNYSIQVKLFIQSRSEVKWADPIITETMVSYKMIESQQMGGQVTSTQPVISNTNTTDEMSTNNGNATSMNTSVGQANSRLDTQEIIQRFKKPSVMQVSVLNASGFSKRAYKLSVYLGKVKKKLIEESLGLKLDIVNIANARSDDYPQSTIYFRENFLKSALFLAELIPGEQKVVPLKDQNEKIGVDIEIFLGKDYK